MLDELPVVLTLSDTDDNYRIIPHSLNGGIKLYPCVWDKTLPPKTPETMGYYLFFIYFSRNPTAREEGIHESFCEIQLR